MFDNILHWFTFLGSEGNGNNSSTEE